MSVARPATVLPSGGELELNGLEGGRSRRGYSRNVFIQVGLEFVVSHFHYKRILIYIISRQQMDSQSQGAGLQDNSATIWPPNSHSCRGLATNLLPVLLLLSEDTMNHTTHSGWIASGEI